MKTNVNVGDILVNSIGSGCDSFFQVVKRTESTISVEEIETTSINHDIKSQTFDSIPVKGRFKKDCNAEAYTLKLHENGDIGPKKRLNWWKVWDGKSRFQCSS